jgi:hypothetical protein
MKNKIHEEDKKELDKFWHYFHHSTKSLVKA